MCDALRYAHGGAACDDPVAKRGVAHGAGRGHIALGPDDRLAREFLMPGHPLHVGMNGALGHDVKPRLGLLLATRPDLDPRWHDPLRFTGEGAAKHVLERFEPVAPPRQQVADGGVGQVGQLDLRGGTADGECLLDFVEGGWIWHATEAESRDLVERRTLSGEARHTTRNRDDKARGTRPAAGGLAALGDELDLDPDQGERLGDPGHVVVHRGERVHALGDEDRRAFIGEGHRRLGAELVGVRVGVVGDQAARGLAVEPLAHQPRVTAGLLCQRIGGPGLWIDHEVLAKHMQSRPSRLLSPSHTMLALDKRLLQLADLALGEDDERKEVIRSWRKLG